MRRAKNTIFPLVIFCTMFGVVLLAQFFFSESNSRADISKLDDNQRKHYDLVLSKIPRVDLYNKNIEFSHKKVVVINFWATWCTPCLEELPSLNKMAKDYSDQLLVLGINSDYEESATKVKKFLANHDISFPNYHDKDNKVADDFMVKTVPVTVIYVDGSVKEVIRGAKDFQAQEFKNQLAEWLKP